jgi:UDP-N-acetylglucosamine--N-acetylmuramyl-(pentapeptide) pyrophosphoryl-undecaprenol N-acetylglucosamine transferase
LAVVEKDAAVLLKESEIEKFESVFTDLIKDSEKQNRLKANIKKMALPNATIEIVNEIDKLIHEN